VVLIESSIENTAVLSASWYTKIARKMESNYSSTKQRLIIASNRLPLSVKEKNGVHETTPSSGGLVSALRGLGTADYLWIGWPGVEINGNDRERVDAALEQEHAAAVYLDKKLATDHYNGFSST
jgi:trehalose 6-phosphate synthase